ncbi:hypothetical protein [Companilactobacillus zhongbaensis]|uniref:hypothetical protein n=1 Tax=Companilactobacillus zhongbaensis TaxID=2486009 RepID=UPI000F76D674|nr:hypothetical protein [Companilactobacillus zhongbaensis]
MTDSRVHINNSVIRWAIDSGECSFVFLKQKYSLDQWMNAKSEIDFPTIQQLLEFGQDTHIPFIYLLGDKIPGDDPELVRLISTNGYNTRPSRRLIEIYDSMKIKQAWVKDYFLEEREFCRTKRLVLINQSNSFQSAYQTIANILNLSELSINDGSYDIIYKLMVDRISDCGVLIFQSGIVGFDSHRELDNREIRSLVLVDEIAPLIFVNTNDLIQNKIFALVHGFVHVLLKSDELLMGGKDCKTDEGKWIESVVAAIISDVLCNDNSHQHSFPSQKDLHFIPDRNFRDAVIASEACSEISLLEASRLLEMSVSDYCKISNATK